MPGAVAATLYLPATVFAANARAVAMPLLSVVAVFMPPAKLPLAPVVGAMKVTTIPGTGLPLLSFTRTCNALPNAVPTVALWLFPATMLSFAGAPAVFVIVNEADPETPVAVATTAYVPVLLFAVNVVAV